MKKPLKPFQKDAIDIVALIKILWNQKKLILIFFVAFAVLGIFMALSTPNYYKAHSVFVPSSETRNDLSGGFGGLAELAGLSLGDGGNAGGHQISPALYPRLISSTDFAFILIKEKLYVRQIGDSMTYADYYKEMVKPSRLERIKSYTIGLPRTILNGISRIRTTKESDSDLSSADNVIIDGPLKVVSFDSDEIVNMDRIATQLDLELDKKAGFITLSFQMSDPFLAAQMAKNAEVLLQNQIKKIKSQKATEQLIFIQGQMEEKRIEFEKIQERLAEFKDRNLNITRTLAQNERVRLESEYDIALGVYSNLANQYEQAKIQVAKDTPIFTIIQSTGVPVEKAGPHRTKIVIQYLIIGIICSFLFIFMRSFLTLFKKKWVTYI